MSYEMWIIRRNIYLKYEEAGVDPRASRIAIHILCIVELITIKTNYEYLKKIL